MTSSSANASASRSFFGQGLFILVPVVVLAVVGLYSLRQDRLLAEAEARQTAQRHADEVSRVIWTQLRSMARLEDPLCHSFRLDAQGRLLFPPPAPAVPSPQPLDPTALGSERAAWWRIVFASTTNDTQRAAALGAADRLLASSPPAAFAGLVRFRRGLLLAEAGRIQDAIRELGEVESQFPDAVTESGLPLQPLARVRQFELLSPRGLIELDHLCSNLVYHPTFLTPHLIERTRDLLPNDGIDRNVTNLVVSWQMVWERHLEIRAVADAALSQISSRVRAAYNPVNPALSTSNVPPVLFWFSSPVPTSDPSSDSGIVADPGGRRLVSLTSRGPVKLNHVQAATRRVVGQDSLRLETPDPSWLGTRVDAGDGSHWIVCQGIGVANSEGFVDVNPASDFWSALEKSFPTPPLWLGLSLEVAGRTVIADRRLWSLALRSAGRGGGQVWTPVATLAAPEILAFSRQVEPGASGGELLRVNVHLVSPQMLYGRQEARTRLFGLLIGLSALVAIVGFISARRAFHRQQRLAEMKSNFVSSVSHELRAPIASVRLMAESLERGTVADPVRQRDYFRLIVQECRRLGTLIENVLDFARIEQGRKQYEPEPTDVAALIRQTVKLIEPAATEKQVTLVTDVADAVPLREPTPVLDPQAMQQALVNLLDNAVKHSPAGGKVTVGAEIGDGDAPTLRLYVEDDGPGIPAEDHARIFERFYRRGSELRRDTPGVGIGLSIVQHVVEAHGGPVIVRSEPGRGSRFTIELPFQQERIAPTTPS